MIPFEEALNHVLEYCQDYGVEQVGLGESLNRVLAEPIEADRDFPPFDRSTKDGIAVNFKGMQLAESHLKIQGIAQAGSSQITLKDDAHCIEIMTGAVLPENSDTVIMYEHLERSNDNFKVHKAVKKGQNIHSQASDVAKGEILLPSGTRITASEIGVLASVGKSNIQVKKLPEIGVVATGNELVEVNEKPLAHQIRKSNTYSLTGLLTDLGILSESYHFKDDAESLKIELEGLLHKKDVLLLSGGVSKGKFDFLPETFAKLGVEKVFHKVLQRPGKPFWFGKHVKTNTLIFSFPGNPVSTFANFHVYFIPWLNKTLGLSSARITVFLKESVENTTGLTLFKGVRVQVINGQFEAEVVQTTGSGDLVGLTKIDGFVQLPSNTKLEKGTLVPLVPTKTIV
ncbi:molybdopterin molybdenumtransferase MoeA [Flagellimonas allohymeniacidonis]|uniref:Molybdopterin molybdenumtransferase n=1 Tax=Flagellimonas allohymeniacidonis TaxID=2517819 RepID=A0A4Q8QND0_9FLAO|nr:molybdopterin molybdenumtransferase MoeA [Allomuricauda hymeniacidonis]